MGIVDNLLMTAYAQVYRTFAPQEKGDTMDLIDRKEAIGWIDSWLKITHYYHPHSKSESIPKSELYDILERIPTVDVEPVRKGRWLPDNNCYYEVRFVCSVCKESEVVPTTGFYKYSPVWNFCPNCGAKMEVGDDT